MTQDATAMLHRPDPASLDGEGITVCIPTYKRPDRLGLLLADVLSQTRLPRQIVVVDNDPQKSAQDVVAQLRQAAGTIEILYDVQPEKNISLTRNRAISHASSPWIAFIDDDERAPPQWLEALATAIVRYEADVVLAPVDPVLPEQAPDWIRRGNFYDGPVLPTGGRVPPNQLRIGNAFMAARLIRSVDPIFDPAYGTTGGEDGDLLLRLMQRGAVIVWSNDAGVTEPVEPARMRLAWILKRALRGGQDFARHFAKGRMGRPSPLQSALFYLRAAIQLCAALLLAVLTLPRGRHRTVHWLARACANFGKLSTLWGWHYREYA